MTHSAFHRNHTERSGISVFRTISERLHNAWRETALAILFWCLFAAVFFFLERIYHPSAYHIVHCWLDDRIPFNRFFVFPYIFWFFFVGGTVLYTFLREWDAFLRLMRFIAITYTAAIVIYLLYPTCQHLRPALSAAQGWLTEFIRWFYRFDTNTNVCPSIHVLGSLGAMYALEGTAFCRTVGRREIVRLTAILICLSTLFMKQHSVLDVLFAVLISWIAYRICFCGPAAAAPQGRATGVVRSRAKG